MRATLLVRSREETIAMATTNIRQYYTTYPQTDGILVLVQDEAVAILSSLDLTSSVALILY
jgi:hypothetical protein